MRRGSQVCLKTPVKGRSGSDFQPCWAVIGKRPGFDGHYAGREGCASGFRVGWLGEVWCEGFCSGTHTAPEVVGRRPPLSGCGRFAIWFMVLPKALRGKLCAASGRRSGICPASLLGHGPLLGSGLGLGSHCWLPGLFPQPLADLRPNLSPPTTTDHRAQGQHGVHVLSGPVHP